MCSLTKSPQTHRNTPLANKTRAARLMNRVETFHLFSFISARVLSKWVTITELGFWHFQNQGNCHPKISPYLHLRSTRLNETPSARLMILGDDFCSSMPIYSQMRGNCNSECAAILGWGYGGGAGSAVSLPNFAL